MTGYAREHRDSLAVLLSRVQRGVQSPAEAQLLRTHVEHLLTEIDQAEAALARVRAELEAIEREAQAMNPYDRDPVAELDRIRAALTGPEEPRPMTKPSAPNDWNGAWPRITVDPTDPDTACVLKLAVRGADRWLLGPQGPFHREGVALATITGEAVRQGLLHLLELGLIDIDRERLHGAGSFPLHRNEEPAP